jgi:hypothetical protein
MIATVDGLTFGNLVLTLKQYGFLEIQTPKGRTFTHSTGALLPFPALNDTDSLRAYHLVAARAALQDYEIAVASAFDRSLWESARVVEVNN